MLLKDMGILHTQMSLSWTLYCC